MVTSEEPGIKKPQLPIHQGLLDLYDEVTEFNDCCAFLCDAFCSLATEEEALDASTVEGLKCFSYWVKQRMVALKTRLKEIQETAGAEVTARDV